jgi:hypothetical protein
LRDLAQRIDTATMERVLSRVVGRQLDPYDAVDLLLAPASDATEVSE